MQVFVTQTDTILTCKQRWLSQQRQLSMGFQRSRDGDSQGLRDVTLAGDLQCRLEKPHHILFISHCYCYLHTKFLQQSLSHPEFYDRWSASCHTPDNSRCTLTDRLVSEDLMVSGFGEQGAMVRWSGDICP